MELTHSEETCCSNERKSHHSEKTKHNLISRLNRIEGQIRGVKGLIEKDTYCDDVLNQISAIQSALNSIGKLLLEDPYAKLRYRTLTRRGVLKDLKLIKQRN